MAYVSPSVGRIADKARKALSRMAKSVKGRFGTTISVSGASGFVYKLTEDRRVIADWFPWHSVSESPEMGMWQDDEAMLKLLERVRDDLHGFGGRATPLRYKFEQEIKAQAELRAERRKQAKELEASF
jgi:hypothetical protein